MITRLYNTKSLHLIFKRSQLAVFALTFTVCTAIFISVSAFALKAYADSSLNVLSEAINERIQPAVVFSDTVTLNQILAEYNHKYPIRSMQVIDEHNVELARSVQNETSDYSLQHFLDRIFFNYPVILNIQHQHQYYGQLIIYGNSSTIVDFFNKIIFGLIIGFLIILAGLLWSVHSFYRYLMKSIHPIVATANTISEEKNYGLRFAQSEIQELQDINTVFNELLEKIQLNDQHLRTENDKLNHQAHHDALTQLPNRYYFYQQLLHIFDSSLREHSALLFIDSNDFKTINDQYGHQAGDSVLQEIAVRLQSQLHPDDFIARLGGDEFAILIHHVHHTDELNTICQQLSECADLPLYFGDVQISFSFSIGVAQTRFASSPEDLITEADNAMYKAKKLPEHWFIAGNDINNQV
ncbi:sensor domain-containing diguanylate cyclase [Acinetobacter sp. WCHAc010052]|uniref:sensor domain-containing diguanylate cyclase n=1 Tax=Acinetobacter sp. WCHAc010052 TaxID=2004647 RepID=UPI000B3C5994|nr:sensor domain-containing diguanylate cyclase [Acinetobacter sp. WCHAc010052]AXY61044.1 sensor domain-containing diguanylate cyclase [Acinetobacter sp. WCHAc010052]